MSNILQKKVILKKFFGFDSFRRGQEEIIDAVDSNKSVLAIMPTGGGKSLCYQLPALMRQGITVVISPLIALMRDQVRSLTQVGVAAAALNSQNTEQETAEIIEKARSGELKMLYIAPEGLSSKKFINLIRSLKIEFIAVDEAHCVSQWGHDFRPDYLKITVLRKKLGNIQLVAFTATADPDTQKDIIKCLFDQKPEIFLNGFDRPNIRLTCKIKNQPRQQLLEFVKDHNNQSGIIYCGSRAKTETLAFALSDSGYKTEFYHAGMDPEKRKEVENKFQTEDGLIVCATVAFGMGIDKPDIRFVVHADLPKSIESYYQEIGRSGRDGLPAESFLLYGLDDVRFRRMQIDESLSELDKKNADHVRLNALLGFVECQGCRRSNILEYFEQKTFPKCQNCDLCSEPPKLFDATDSIRKVLSVILRTKENYGAAHLIDILRGLKTIKVQSSLHDKLPTFGLGSDRSKQEWHTIFLQMMGLDYIRPSPERRGAFYLTKKSLPILKGNQAVTLKLISTERTHNWNKQGQPLSLVTEKDEPLFINLRQKRKELAVAMNVPSYIVFSDKTLIEMASKKPVTIDEMSLISGVGQKKLLKFGDQFLRVINPKMVRKMHPLRKKIAGQPKAELYDIIVDVINKNSRGATGLDKPLHVSPSLILKISEVAPKKISDLKRINGMTQRLLERFGKPLVRAVKLVD